jgi:nucleotide-binding universal stress UspA family protein
VLIAVDGTRMSERVVRTAHRLFGEAATYLAINVGSVPDTRMSWAYVWPVSGPTTWNPSTGVDDIAHDEGRTAAGLATDEAAAIACGAGLVQATSLGDVGDPSTAIVQAARHHRADVVVIGADSRGWLGRLFDDSVERDVLREAGSAVLVVDAGGTVAQR